MSSTRYQVYNYRFVFGAYLMALKREQLRTYIGFGESGSFVGCLMLPWGVFGQFLSLCILAES